MRVTDAMLFNQVSAGADAASSSVQVAQNQVASGLAFTSPDQAPAAAGQAIVTAASVAQFTSLQSTVTAATNDVQAASGALTNVYTAITQAQQLAEQYANGTLTATQRAAGAAQIQGILSTIISEMNTEQGTHYVFGGTADTLPPFSSTGVYSGNTQSRTAEIAPGVQQDISIPIADLMTGSNGGANVIGTLQSLSTALTNNDVSGIQAALDPLQQGVTELSTAQASAGATLSILTASSTANQSAQLAAQSQLSSLTDADAIQATSNLALAQQALQSALSGATQTFHLFLVDQLPAG